MLTLLARLGLRAGEVAALTLDDIDWRAGEITVRGKGSRAERLPLPADAGEAVAGYLRDGRPEPFEGARQVFLRARAPHRALTAGGVSGAVSTAGQRAGIGPVHAHRLRHSAATGMLQAGASLSEIGRCCGTAGCCRRRSMPRPIPRRCGCWPGPGPVVPHEPAAPGTGRIPRGAARPGL